MARTLTFAGKEIKGTFGAIVPAITELHVVRQRFFGVNGISEIVGGRGARDLHVSMWLHDNFAKPQDVYDYVSTTLVPLQGKHGTLDLADTNNSNLNQSFPRVTFDGFMPEPLRGQETPAAMQDIAGTVEATAGKWFLAGRLKFTQLRV